MTEAIVAGLCLLSLRHSLILSSDTPFVTPSLFRDRNSVTANLFLFLTGVVAVRHCGAASLPYYRVNELSGDPVRAGDRAARHRHHHRHVRGRAAWSRASNPRLVVAAGLRLTALSLWQMAHYSLLMDPWPVMIAGLLTGIGVGGVNVALSTVAFVTLPQHFAQRRHPLCST